ncbi:hypothetical protein [Hydrogenophaga sp.]|uniref:hypothetical protein n=1 Tax=Hydrogenophaga sp. TaxID=1904254 RepID=UPI0019869AB3|nr:hypothetical protein [Hydrogenophaga sp.]MBD3893786.1 hypothetical protein [Hydrogenophaga sp.]
MRHDVSPRTATFSGHIALDDSWYGVNTPQPLQMGAFYPVAGVLQLSDGHGSRVDVHMGQVGFTLTLYLPGDDEADAESEEFPWTD